MFVGHGFLAWTVVALLASHRGSERRAAIAIGVLAGAFATLPDVDVVHPLVSVVLQPVNPLRAPDAFWAASTVVHRTATHSLLVGAALAVGVVLVATGVTTGGGRRRILAGSVLLAALVWTVHAVSGGLAAPVVGVEVVGGLALAWLGTRFGVGSRWLVVAALVGLLSHPFGDLVTGQPPALLYPLGVELLGDRVTLHADPTVHLVGAFLLELATVWAALVVFFRLHGWRIRGHVHPRASLGAGYGAAVFAVPAPTLDAATPFVFSVLAVGLLGAPVGLGDDVPPRWRGVTTALAAVTVAALAFLGGYLVA